MLTYAKTMKRIIVHTQVFLKADRSLALDLI